MRWKVGWLDTRSNALSIHRPATFRELFPELLAFCAETITSDASWFV